MENKKAALELMTPNTVRTLWGKVVIKVGERYQIGGIFSPVLSVEEAAVILARG